MHTVGDLCQYVNSKLERSDQAPLYMYADNEIVTSKQSVIAEVYQEYRENDFFLYLGYFEENIYDKDSWKWLWLFRVLLLNYTHVHV